MPNCDEAMNVRVIKPYKQFYNELMTICLKYGVFDLRMVSSSDFLDAAKSVLGKQWKDRLEVPAERFFQICVQEELKCTSKKLEDFFERVKCRMLEEWNKEVVNNACKFGKIIPH